ncbi:MAG TPA: DUF6569 family protein [Polyangia bacterium]|nr:DUF6569 family protein [Polyangia bacterium]
MHGLARAAIGAAALAALAFPALSGAQGQAFDLDPGTKVLAPLQFKQLSVFPVVQAKATVDTSQYLTLADGLKQKKVKVTEAKQGAQVNRVTVANQSDRPLILLGGEVILGGQQDRVIGKDTIVAPHQEANLEVFCVEHGRWTGRRDFDGVGGLAENKIRVRAKYRSDQGQVWDEVAKKNAALQAKPQSGTYRNLVSGPEGEKAVKPYREAITAGLAKLPESKKLVGVIAAINGRVVSVDIFSTPELFASYRERLLDSIYVSAADVPVTKTAAPQAGEVKAFLMRAESAPAQPAVEDPMSRRVDKKGKDTLNTTLEIKRPGAAPKQVYKSYQADE